MLNMPISVDGLLEFAGLRKTHKYGVAFAGGGAKGFAHIGVLTAMEEFGIVPQIMSGVSAGSIAAVLYGAGLTPHDMIDCFANLQKFGDFTEWSVPKEGFFKLNKFGKLLESWLPVRNLEDMKIPTVVCATNFDKGTSVGWLKGEIVPRVMASCSIPILFRPVRINGGHYVDGGVLRNLPAWAIRKHCKVLIGSNCSPIKKEYRYKSSLADIAMRTFQLVAKSNAMHDIRLCDYVISPQTFTISSTFDLTSLRRNVRMGYDAACSVLETIVK